MLSKKNITRLLNPGRRRAVLAAASSEKRRALKTAEYARYVVDEQLKNRDYALAGDKSSSWGFPPIGFLCSVKADGSVQNRLFEMNIVNHFLKDEDGDAACEVVEAVLLMWKAEDRSIRDFDPDAIDGYLAEAERKYAEKQAEKEQDAVGK